MAPVMPSGFRGTAHQWVFLAERDKPESELAQFKASSLKEASPKEAEVAAPKEVVAPKGARGAANTPVQTPTKPHTKMPPTPRSQGLAKAAAARQRSQARAAAIRAQYSPKKQAKANDAAAREQPHAVLWILRPAL